MKEWRTIKSEIEDALENLDCSVYYQRPCGHGYNATCSYFEISIDEDWDWEYVESCLRNVAEEYDLDFDYNSDSSLDLDAHWDIND